MSTEEKTLSCYGCGRTLDQVKRLVSLREGDRDNPDAPLLCEDCACRVANLAAGGGRRLQVASDEASEGTGVTQVVFPDGIVRQIDTIELLVDGCGPLISWKGLVHLSSKAPEGVMVLHTSSSNLFHELGSLMRDAMDRVYQCYRDQTEREPADVEAGEKEELQE